VRRRCCNRIVGPGVAGITALEVLGDVFPRATPEAGQVARGLDGSMRGREKHEQQRYLAIGDGGVTVEAEQLLHADFEGWAVLGFVVDREMAARGCVEMAGQQTVDLLPF